MSGAPTPDPFSTRQLQALRQLIDQRIVTDLHARRLTRAEHIRNLRLAITVERDGTYPASGDTFAIRFVDCGFTPREPGSSTQTCKERTAEGDTDDADDVIAREINGQYVPEGTYVAALWQRGLEGDPDDYGEWWIRLKGSAPCWTWEDTFDRNNSTDVGTDWAEGVTHSVGDWEILANELHEKAGGNGTADAILFSTQSVPARSPGEMVLRVVVIDPEAGDVFRLFPACVYEDSEYSIGLIYAEFVYMGAGVWSIEVIEVATLDVLAAVEQTSAPIVEGEHTLFVCVDHSTEMVKAGIISDGQDGPAWASDVDPGEGRYFALGHDNATNGGTFDDFYVTELRAGTLTCSECWCYCWDYPPGPQLHAEFYSASGRAHCLAPDPPESPLSWAMVYEWNTGLARWYGEVVIPPGDHGSEETFEFSLTCSSDNDDDPAWPGRNFTLDWVSNRCCDYNSNGCGTYLPIAAASTCDPFVLVFGPFVLRCDDLNCNACWNALTPAKPPPDIGCDESSPNVSGEFYIVITDP